MITFGAGGLPVLSTVFPDSLRTALSDTVPTDLSDTGKFLLAYLTFSVLRGVMTPRLSTQIRA